MYQTIQFFIWSKTGVSPRLNILCAFHCDNTTLK